MQSTLSFRLSDRSRDTYNRPINGVGNGSQQVARPIPVSQEPGRSRRDHRSHHARACVELRRKAARDAETYEPAAISRNSTCERGRKRPTITAAHDASVSSGGDASLKYQSRDPEHRCHRLTPNAAVTDCTMLPRKS